MSNIAVPSRTSGFGPDRAVAAARTLLGALVLTLLLTSLTPYQAMDETARSGNLVNQVGYGALGLLVLVSHFMFTERRVALALLRPAWLLMAAFMLASVLQSGWPEEAFRAVLFTLLAMIAATGALCLPADAVSFRTALKIAAFTVLGLCYVGLLVFPADAIHSSGSIESEHAGLWRGIYSHKNVAGPVMAALFFSGLYLVRSGDSRSGWTIALLAALFVYQTGSKTSAGLVPLVAVMIAGGRWIGGRWLPAVILSFAVAGMALLTLGTVLSPALDAILQAILPGTTFTGRTDLWRFALDLLEERQWGGYGFESFWQTPVVYRAEAPIELSWDPRGIVHSHNGYLDIAMSMGWPALFVAAFVLFLLPLRDFLACGRGKENSRLADLFLMILAFALLNSFLESYLFRRADPVWMLTWISVVGLRLTARFSIDATAQAPRVADFDRS